MRFFEILLLLLPLALLLALLLPLPRPRWWGWLPLLALVLLPLHLLLEGYRWQMLPAYGLNALLLLTFRRTPAPASGRRWLPRLAAVAGLLLLIVAVLPPILLPVPRLPAPGGPFAVGTTSFLLVDENRPEIYTNDPADKRAVMAQIWYPAAAGADEPAAPYLDAPELAGPIVATRFGLPEFALNHLPLIRTHSQVDAGAADGRFPVIIFSHGLGSFRAQNTAQMELLASHGYIVAAVDHTYGAVFSIFPDGKVTSYDGEAVFGVGDATLLMNVWAEDIGFLLTALRAENEREGQLLTGRFDFEHLGMFGHSTGGGTTAIVCAEIARCDAALFLDAWLEPVPAPIISAGLSVPTLFMSSPEWLGADNRALGRTFYTAMMTDSFNLTFAGTEHRDFSDFPLLSPVISRLGLEVSPVGRSLMPAVNDYTLSFFDAYLRGADAPLLAGPAAAYPAVAFERR